MANYYLNKTAEEISNALDSVSTHSAEITSLKTNKVGYAEVVDGILNLYDTSSKTTLIKSIVLPSGGSGGGLSEAQVRAIVTSYGYALASDVPTVPTSDINANTSARHTHSNKAFLDTLSGIKTVNNQSLIGDGNITVEGGSGGSSGWTKIREYTIEQANATSTTSDSIDFTQYSKYKFEFYGCVPASGNKNRNIVLKSGNNNVNFLYCVQNYCEFANDNDVLAFTEIILTLNEDDNIVVDVKLCKKATQNSYRMGIVPNNNVNKFETAGYGGSQFYGKVRVYGGNE